MAVANLFIVGVVKGGTTSLFAYLAQHPDICPCREKEPHYFSPLRLPGGHLAPLERYDALFAHCGDAAYRMEATPIYFFGGARVIEAIRGTAPDAKVVVSLRDPVSRIWSNYRYKRQKGVLGPEVSFEEFLDRCEEVAARDEVPPDLRPYMVLAHNRYEPYLRQWHEVFGGAFRVIFFDDVIARPREVVADLCAWLDLDPTAVRDFDLSARNVTYEPRSRAVHRAAVAVRRRAAGTLQARPRLQDALRKAYGLVNAQTRSERMPPAQRARLDAYYDAPNARLRRLLLDLGYEDLPRWLADADKPTARGRSGP